MSEEVEAVELVDMRSVVIALVLQTSHRVVHTGTARVLAVRPTRELLNDVAQGLCIPDEALTCTSEWVVSLVAGEYKIPLMPHVPVLRQNSHYFAFFTPNLIVELLLSPGTRSEIAEAFVAVLEWYTVLHTRNPPQPLPTLSYMEDPLPQAGVAATEACTAPSIERVAQVVGSHVGTVGDVSAKALARGAAVLSGGIGKGFTALRERIAPGERVTVSPLAKTLASHLHVASKGVVFVSRSAAASMLCVTTVLGNFIGTTIADRLNGMPRNPQLAAAQAVGGSIVDAGGRVFTAAVEAATVVLTATSEGIGGVVRHRFGDDVGDLADDTMGVVANLVQAEKEAVSKGGILMGTAKVAAQRMGGQ